MSRSSENDFETLEKLGAGSFGTVYKVRRIVDGELYVIKNVRIVDMSYEEQISAINEVKLMSQMDNNNVVRYFDSFLTKDSLHIVMEYCNKGDVQSLLKKAKSKGLNSLREPLIWNISLQVMLGMYYIHKKKILHRDLKTANIFLEKKSGSDHYCAKIGDLGVAKLLETSTAFAQTIIGTPYYLSPELCADQPYRDKSDCWALGVVIYECCTLDHPFDARNQCALILKIIQCPVPLMLPKHGISKPLERMVSWLLEKDPNKRPTIKALLCERFVREQLRANDFELPEELLDEPVTNKLFPESDPVPSTGSSKSLLVQQSPVAARKTGSSIGNTGTGSSSGGGNVAVLPSKKSSAGNSLRGVRGDRVRGGGSRVTSTVAMERHQVARPSPSSSRKLRDDEYSRPSELNPSSSSEPKNTAVDVPRRHSMNIIDDGTIETIDSKVLARELRTPSMQRNAADGPAPVSEEKIHRTNSVHNSAKDTPAPVNYDDDVDEQVEEAEGEDWYDEDFDEVEEEEEDNANNNNKKDTDNDAKSTEESEAVMRLQSFAVLKPHPVSGSSAAAGSGGSQQGQGALVSNSSSSWREAKLVDAGVQESKEQESVEEVACVDDEWDLDPGILQGLINEYREKSVNLLGEEIFYQVYDLCAQFMMADISSKEREGDEGGGSSSSDIKGTTVLLHNLEKTICEHLHAGIDVACEIVFNVKLLLALESRLEDYNAGRRSS